MAALITLLFVYLGFAGADVAHLARSYLPPSRLLAAAPKTEVEIVGSRTASFTVGNGYTDRLVQAAPATSYVAPESFSERFVQAAPARSYIAPASASFTSTNQISGYSAPARLTAPVTQTFIAPTAQTYTTYSQNFVAPVPQRLVSFQPAQAQAPAPSRFPASSGTFTSARLTSPSREYLSPEIETLEPLVQQSYTAPAVTYNAPVSSAPSAPFTSGLDTQYASDGGYVY